MLILQYVEQTALGLKQPYDLGIPCKPSSWWAVLEAWSFGILWSGIYFLPMANNIPEVGCFFKYIILFAPESQESALIFPTEVYCKHRHHIASFPATDISDTIGHAGSQGPNSRAAYTAAWICCRTLFCTVIFSKLTTFLVTWCVCWRSIL